MNECKTSAHVSIIFGGIIAVTLSCANAFSAMKLSDFVEAMNKIDGVNRAERHVLASPDDFRRNLQKSLSRNGKLPTDPAKEKHLIDQTMAVLKEEARVVLKGEKIDNLKTLSFVFYNSKGSVIAKESAGWLLYIKKGDLGILKRLLKIAPAGTFSVLAHAQDTAFPKIFVPYVQQINSVVEIVDLNLKIPINSHQLIFFQNTYKFVIQALGFQKTTTAAMANLAFRRFQVKSRGLAIDAVKVMALIKGTHAKMMRKQFVKSLFQQELFSDLQHIVAKNPKYAALVNKEKAQRIYNLKSKVKNLRESHVPRASGH